MAKSLFENCPDSKLFVICFDETCFEILQKLNLPGVIPISLESFEDAELKKARLTRTAVEYFWTCTPSVPLYLLQRYPEIDLITYLDADLMFFNQLEMVFDLMKDHSILITPHRYTPEYDRSNETGIYCVQFVSFKRDSVGMAALNWWRGKCLEWCYNYFDEGKFGDQKYLDHWPDQFKNVFVCEHLGVGAAPWNIQQYKVTKKDNAIYINHDPLVFYHFHSLKMYQNMEVNVGDYPIKRDAVQFIYRPYWNALCSTYREIRKMQPEFIMGFSAKPFYLRYFLHNLKIRLQGGSPVIAK
jgi:hypothetical protein